MNSNPDFLPGPRNPLAAIRRFARPRPQEPEHCELCSAPIGAAHQHLLELSTRNLTCSCDACAVLFGDQHAGGYRRVPRRLWRLADFQISDLEWESLQIPIGLAFFFHHSGAKRTIAYFPSPAGATESLLPLDSWQELETANPVLRQMQPDVEALLVNRVREAREYYLAPLDQCYRLVGLIRAHWRGLAGGVLAWEEIDRFFADLQKRARPPREAQHA